MKARVVIIGVVCLVVAFAALSLTDLSATGQETKATVQTLPSSLDNFYPPKSSGPIYLVAMLDLAKYFTGVVCDVQENDMINARSNFRSLKQLYLEAADMIPEWKQEYPMESIEQLEAALATGDPSQIMPAVDAAGGVCHRCHVTFMAPVQQKYRWGNFADLVLTDPLSGQDVGLANLMMMMETNFAGIGVDLEQGQFENARLQLTGFSERFNAIAEACMACHNSERKYYVDKSITDLISRMKMELSKDDINPGSVGGLLQTIGEESCSKCHLVHIPAAYAQQGIKSSKH